MQTVWYIQLADRDGVQSLVGLGQRQEGDAACCDVGVWIEGGEVIRHRGDEMPSNLIDHLIGETEQFHLDVSIGGYSVCG